MKILFGIVIFLLISMHANAASVYSTQDANGNTTYSDTPSGNATVEQVPTTGNITTPTYNTIAVPTAPVAEIKDYKSFVITSPEDQATFQNTRRIGVDFKIDPALQKGDLIVVKVDGTPFGSPSASTPVTIDQLDRGTHIISAEIIRGTQTIIKSNLVTVFIHYANLGTTGGG